MKWVRRMCEYCRSYPHLPGCPNEPEPSYEKECVCCGKVFDEEDLFYGLCKTCISHQYQYSLGQKLIEQMPEDFVWYALGVSLSGCSDNTRQAARVLIKDFYQNPSYYQNYREDMVRSFVLEERYGEWAAFLYEELEGKSYQKTL